MAVILVVDDEEMVRTLVSTVLKSRGHTTMEASNGLEAVALFRSYHERISLVITDIRMPVMDGVEAAHRILETRPDMKIICMSGDAGDRCPTEVSFLAKPFSADKLRDAVSELLPA